MEDQDPVRKDRPNRRYAIWAAIAFAVGVFVFIAIANLSVFGEGFHAVFAVFLGVFFTVAMAIALMGLSFHSARSGHDDEIED